jgi:hypothetical protein
MGYIFVDRESEGGKEMRSQMRSQMRNHSQGGYRMQGGAYSDGYRDGYKHGWEDHEVETNMEPEESAENFRRHRDSRGRYM